MPSQRLTIRRAGLYSQNFQKGPGVLEVTQGDPGNHKGIQGDPGVIRGSFSGFKIKKRANIPDIDAPVAMLTLDSILVTCLLGVECLLPGRCPSFFWTPLGEVGEPYQEEGYYMSAEEYAHLSGRHALSGALDGAD